MRLESGLSYNLSGPLCVAQGALVGPSVLREFDPPSPVAQGALVTTAAALALCAELPGFAVLVAATPPPDGLAQRLRVDSCDCRAVGAPESKLPKGWFEVWAEGMTWLAFRS